MNYVELPHILKLKLKNSTDSNDSVRFTLTFSIWQRIQFSQFIESVSKANSSQFARCMAIKICVFRFHFETENHVFGTKTTFLSCMEHFY